MYTTEVDRQWQLQRHKAYKGGTSVENNTDVHFNIANIQWVVVGIPHYSSEDTGLITLMRSGNAVCLTAMVRSRANNYTENRITVGFCVFQAL